MPRRCGRDGAYGDLTASVLNEAGTATLATLPTVAAGFTTTGGIAFRAFDSVGGVNWDVDTLQVRRGAIMGACAAGSARPSACSGLCPLDGGPLTLHARAPIATSEQGRARPYIKAEAASCRLQAEPRHQQLTCGSGSLERVTTVLQRRTSRGPSEHSRPLSQMLPPTLHAAAVRS